MDRKPAPVPVQMWAGVSPVPVQMWAGVSPVPVQMWAGVSPVPVQMRRGCAPAASPETPAALSPAAAPAKPDARWHPPHPNARRQSAQRQTPPFGQTAPQCTRRRAGSRRAAHRRCRGPRAAAQGRLTPPLLPEPQHMRPLQPLQRYAALCSRGLLTVRQARRDAPHGVGRAR